MLIDPGHHLGDAWFHVDGEGVAHCYYLRCPDHLPRHRSWDIAHATSHDLRTWERHGLVLERGADDAWDGGCLATGSVVATDDGYLMAYTARWDQPEVATGLASSDDLFRWTKHPANPATAPGPPYAGHRPRPGRPGTHWRDPFLVRGADGSLRQLLCAAAEDGPADTSGTVAVATRNGDGTWDLAAPLDVEPVGRELECPQVREVDGRWFLVFSSFGALFGDARRTTHGEALRAGTYAMAGDGPDGPFRLTHPRPIVDEHHAQQPYAGQLVAFEGGHVLLGTLWRPGVPDAISDPITVVREGDRLRA